MRYILSALIIVAVHSAPSMESAADQIAAGDLSTLAALMQNDHFDLQAAEIASALMIGLRSAAPNEVKLSILVVLSQQSHYLKSYRADTAVLFDLLGDADLGREAAAAIRNTTVPVLARLSALLNRSGLNEGGRLAILHAAVGKTEDTDAHRNEFRLLLQGLSRQGSLRERALAFRVLYDLAVTEEESEQYIAELRQLAIVHHGQPDSNFIIGMLAWLARTEDFYWVVGYIQSNPVIQDPVLWIRFLQDGVPEHILVSAGHLMGNYDEDDQYRIAERLYRLGQDRQAREMVSKGLFSDNMIEVGRALGFMMRTQIADEGWHARVEAIAGSEAVLGWEVADTARRYQGLIAVRQ